MQTTTRATTILALSLTLGLAGLAAARTGTAQRPPYGIYSSLEAMDGDIGGFELIILPSNEGDFLVFQEAEGWPARPLLLEVRLGGTRAEDAGAVGFDHPRMGPFQGRITGDTLAGEFTRMRYRIELIRGPSFWQ
jgi:hypothetical protein